MSKGREIDWREILENEEEVDDGLLEQTPPDVVAVLGFDPLELDDEEEETEKTD